MTTIPLVDGNELPVFGLASFRRDKEEDTRFIVNKFLNLAIDQGIINVEITELFGNGHIILNTLFDSGLKRSDFFITFKVWSKNRNGQEIITACLENLKIIGTEYFDLILIHSPIDTKNKFEQWSGLEVLKDQGITKSIGLCGYSEKQLVELMKFCQTQPSVLEVIFFNYKNYFHIILFKITKRLK
jgi:2,5-diketo-D-gluconate reductase A